MDYEAHEDAPDDIEEFLVSITTDQKPTNIHRIEEHREFWISIGEERIVEWIDEWVRSLKNDGYITSMEDYEGFLDALEELDVEF